MGEAIRVDRTPPARPWPLRVDGACLCDLAAEADRARLQQIRATPAMVLLTTRRYPLLLHPQSPADAVLAAPAPAPASTAAGQLADALVAGEAGLDGLCEVWNGAFRGRATAVGHRFDLYADYLASAREFVLCCLQAAEVALPAGPQPAARPRLERFLDRYAATMRQGAMKYADRDMYRLTRQMLREGVLTWRDERGRVQEHPALRSYATDPAPIVSEHSFRTELTRFVYRHGPKILGGVIWERFRLHWIDGLTQQAVADRHGVSQQAVSESLAAAAVRLREAFVRAGSDP